MDPPPSSGVEQESIPARVHGCVHREVTGALCWGDSLGPAALAGVQIQSASLHTKPLAI